MHRVAKEIKLYCWRRELVQRGLSMAHRELHPFALHLRRGVVTWPALAKARKLETYFAPTWLTRRALRAVIADREERSRWSKRLKELLETRDVLQALNAFDPVANRRLGGKWYHRNRVKSVAAPLTREWEALGDPNLIAPENIGSLTRPPFGQMWRSFTGPTEAMPIDLFRIFVGLLSCAYFSRTFLEAPAFSSPHGLIDHRLVRKTLWYTCISFFPPEVGLTFFRVLYLLATMGSLLLAAGIGVKPVSAFLYATAVSTYRWNFLVTYVDDALMHLILLWMVLLPIGHTLTLPEWLSERAAAVERWKQVQVPGTTVRCLLANLALVYIVAGLWKWTSPLWRQGLAVYATLKTAVSRTPDLWRPNHVPILSAANHMALVLEPLFPAAFVLPTNHPLKWSLGTAMVGFHAGIITTLKIPFANIACIAASVIVFGEEIMARLRVPLEKRPPSESSEAEVGLPETLALLLVAFLALAMLSEALRPYWRYGTPPVVRENKQLANRTPGVSQNPFYGLLWFAGLAQSYRLFDWIDHYNYHITYEVIERRGDGTIHRLDDKALFPRTIRNVLLQSYLHDVTWMKVPRQHLSDLQHTVFERYVRRYCTQYGDTGLVEVFADVQRTTAGNLDLSSPQRARLLTFTCRGGEPHVHFMHLAKG